MSFTPNIPVTGQSLGVTKVPFNNNFAAINATISQNHVAMNLSGQGKHNFLQMPDQTAAGTPATLSNESAFFSRLASSVNNTYMSQGGRAKKYQLSTIVANSTADPLFGTYTPYSGVDPNLSGGWTFLPGGLLLQYGFRSGGGKNPTIIFPIPLSSGSSIFSITITPRTVTPLRIGVSNVIQTSFDAHINDVPDATNPGIFWSMISTL